MTLEKLQKEMITAMKNKDKLRKDTISALIGNIKKAAIDQNCRNDIPESLIDKVVLKEKKTIQEMIDTCPKDRIDTLEEYNKKMIIVNEFAPKMMSEEEIKKIIFEKASLKDICDGNRGKIMKTIAPVFKGKADMKIVSAILTEILTE